MPFPCVLLLAGSVGAMRTSTLARVPAHALARVSTSRRALVGASDQPPLRVAIAGGGVGGLTTALCLLKKGFDVTVYERTDAFRRFGGPIQFASNALSTLYAIDPGARSAGPPPRAARRSARAVEPARAVERPPALTLFARLLPRRPVVRAQRSSSA
jgi:NADPH-dependent 2,4-dienoyl-CoA reductase/sulfur reductase-like enzyme